MEIFNNIASNMATTTAQKSAEIQRPVADVSGSKINTESSAQQPKGAAELNKQNSEEMKAKLDEAVNDLNEYMQKMDTNLRFGYNQPLNTLTVSLINTQNGDTIRQYPSEQVIRMRENLQEQIRSLFKEQGLLMDQTN